MVIAACACAWLAGFVTTEQWTEWFSHPAQQRPELTRDGAALWRTMLPITALMLVVAPALWITFGQHTAKIVVHQTTPSHKRSRLRMWGMITIVVMALGMRSWRINESLWYDEIASWMTYAGGARSIGAVFGNFFDPINHPFHSLLNFLSVNWLSDSLGVEIAFRLPALLFSLASVIVMYGFARSVSGERAGLIAAGIAAVLPVSILEGVEARGYSMMICFSAAASWLLIAARQKNRSWLWFMYAAICALGVWAHFVTALAPIGHGAWLAWRGVRYREWRQAIRGGVALTLGATMAITLYSPMLPGMLWAREMFAAQEMSQPTILGPEGMHALLQMGGSWYWWAALPGLALILVGLIVIAMKRGALQQLQTANAAVEISLIGLPLMLIGVALSGTWVYARFMLFALPGTILLIAVAVDALMKWRSPVGWLAILAMVAFSMADLAIRPPKQPLRDAVEYVAANRSSHDQILAIGLAHEVLRIYANDLNLTYSLRHGIDLSQKLSGVQPQWIIVEYPRSLSRETYQIIDRAGYANAAHFDGWVDWTNGDVLVYRRQ